MLSCSLEAWQWEIILREIETLNVATRTGSNASRSEQQTIHHGSKVSCEILSTLCVFYAPLQPSQIQFKCKATEEELFLFAIYSRSASAILQALAHIESVHLLLHHTTAQPDQSIASDWLLDILDLYLIRMDRPFGHPLPFMCLSLFFFWHVLWLNSASKGKPWLLLNLFFSPVFACRVGTDLY